MKKLIMLFVGTIVFAGFVLAEPPLMFSVSTNSILVLPKRTLQGAAIWKTNHVYAQGSYVETNSQIYVALTAGTSGTNLSNAPDHAYGIDTNDNGIAWYRVNDREPRYGYSISNGSTNDVYLSRGFPAEISKGEILSTIGSYAGEDSSPWQGEIFAISPVDIGSVIYVQEW